MSFSDSDLERRYESEMDDSFEEEEEDSEEDSEMYDSEEEDSEVEDSDDSFEEKEVRPKKVRKLKEKIPKEVRNWLELPPDVMSQIFLKLDTIDILFRVQSVCSAWRKLAKEPQFYRSIDMHLQWKFFDRGELVWEKMAKVALDRSCGQCVDFAADDFPTDELMRYIADKCPPLRRLRLVSCYDIGEEAMVETAKNLPLLEEVEIIFGSFSDVEIEAFGHSCPLLKYFRLSNKGDNGPDRFRCNADAHSIARSMPGLHHLHLFGNSLSDKGLQAILDGCPHLKSIDLRQCFNLNFRGDLKKRCADRNIELKLPNDSTIGYDFDAKCIGDADSDSDSPPDSYFWFNYNNSDCYPTVDMRIRNPTNIWLNTLHFYARPLPLEPPLGDSSEEEEDSEMYDKEEEEGSDDSSGEKKVRIRKEKGPKEVRNWLELPPDVMSQIFLKLDTIDILFRVQSVCSAWRKLAKEPQLYRSIDMQLQWRFFGIDELYWEKMAIEAVDRSCGQLVDFAAESFPTDKLKLHIADKNTRYKIRGAYTLFARPRCIALRRLRLVSCYRIFDEPFIETVKKLPLLEEVEICHYSFAVEALEAIGLSCPLLKYFRLNRTGCKGPNHIECDAEALSIAWSMPGLHHLHLFGTFLTDTGLLAILDGCQHLKSIDLRQCFSVNFGGDLKKRCTDRNLELKLPNDTTIGHEFDTSCGDWKPNSPPDSYFWFNYNLNNF